MVDELDRTGPDRREQGRLVRGPERESPSPSAVSTHHGFRFNLASVDGEWRTENTAWESETQLALRPTQLDWVQLKVLPTEPRQRLVERAPSLEESG